MSMKCGKMGRRVFYEAGLHHKQLTCQDDFFSEIFWRKAMVAYKKPQQMQKEENKRLTGERGQIKLIGMI